LRRVVFPVPVLRRNVGGQSRISDAARERWAPHGAANRKASDSGHKSSCHCDGRRGPKRDEAGIDAFRALFRIEIWRCRTASIRVVTRCKQIYPTAMSKLNRDRADIGAAVDRAFIRARGCFVLPGCLATRGRLRGLLAGSGLLPLRTARERLRRAEALRTVCPRRGRPQ